MLNKALRKLILDLKDDERDLRESILKDNSLYDGYNTKLESLHIEHAQELDRIISEHGWPGKSLVGEDGATAAYILAENSISQPRLQMSFFDSIKNAAQKGEASKLQVACLEDRILFNQGKPQKYGLLFDWNEMGELFTNVDNIELANQRRKSFGLNPIEDDIKSQRKKIEEEGDGPPSDYHNHKRLEIEWAKRVGWR